MVIKVTEAEYVCAKKIRVRLKVTDSVLLRLVASGQVRTQVEPGCRPVFHIGDIVKALPNLPREGITAPGPSKGKGRKKR